MKKSKKIVLIMISINVIFYLLMSYIKWSWWIYDPQLEVRAMLAFIALIMNLIILGVCNDLLQEEVKK